MRERLNLNVSINTTQANIDLLQFQMQTFVSSKENSRDFQSNVDIELVVAPDLGRLEIIVGFGYKSNTANEPLRPSRRNRFYNALIEAVRRIPIYGPGGGGVTLGESSKPSYTVAILHEESMLHREKFLKKKEAKRLVPSTEVKEDTAVSTGVSLR
jgi:hypothetical protein